MIFEQVSAAGIDYDAFREMKLPEEIIQSTREKISLSTESNVSIADQQDVTWDAVDSLTLTMMIHQFDLKEARPISKKNTIYLLQCLYYNESFLELKKYYTAILKDIECFPVPCNSDGKSNVTFDDSWNSYRSYGGNRRHEGTDLMPEKNIRGYYPIISMTDGTIEKLGWLEQGGYRIGIRGNAGAYYYYAHLDSYAPDIKLGDIVKAGQFLGLMGDSGYGSEGTRGMFDVHLHVGIYVETSFGELSINPYCIVRYLEKE
jgi:murein DD-endopeptidase MepM/ murein hydrolase activator NlpD